MDRQWICIKGRKLLCTEFISILDDYLTYEEMSESERSRWQAVYDEYQKIRGELTKKTVYNRKMYGLFVDYNALADMSRSQQQQILQSYY